MKLSEFDYCLPKELIAQYPHTERDRCRLMVLDRKSGGICHRSFSDIIRYLSPGDCLVLNNTKVIPSRLLGKRASGGRVEIFLLGNKDPVSEALIKPSGRIKIGEEIILESGDRVQVLDRGVTGRFVRFARPVREIVAACGHVPLPPYIDRADSVRDRADYQTVYGEREGATACPTAGLHFTHELIKKISAQGVKIAYVTLHTNYGTFAPVKTDEVEAHKMHAERFELPAETIEVVRGVKRSGGRVIAVGTTSTRVLEHNADVIEGRGQGAVAGETSIFMYPGYAFRIVDGLVTNFHLPKSTLLLLVSAFAGKESVFEAYRQAIETRYRFFSYGDAMLIV